MKILITGAAGFIGFHLVNRLVKENYQIIGLDNINDYYDLKLKNARLKETGISTEDFASPPSGGVRRSRGVGNKILITSRKYPNYRFVKMDILDKEGLFKLFKEENFDFVIHLAAQAGVRYSIKNPQAYIDSNIIGFFNLLEACSVYKPKHLIFASSSSVYGNNSNVPFSVNDNTDHPVSLYAATKKSNEVMAHAYSSLFGIPVTGLRFFTVYGPWGRPDMAYFSFTKNILEGKQIKIFNNGELYRDFTYIDDIIDGICKLITIIPERNQIKCIAGYRLFNIGNNSPVKLTDFIESLERVIGKKAIKEYAEHQLGDVLTTCADIDDLNKLTGFSPRTNLKDGLTKFYEWYKNYYGIYGQRK